MSKDITNGSDHRENDVIITEDSVEVGGKKRPLTPALRKLIMSQLVEIADYFGPSFMKFMDSPSADSMVSTKLAKKNSKPKKKK